MQHHRRASCSKRSLKDSLLLLECGVPAHPRLWGWDHCWWLPWNTKQNWIWSFWSYCVPWALQVLCNRWSESWRCLGWILYPKAPILSEIYFFLFPNPVLWIMKQLYQNCLMAHNEFIAKAKYNLSFVPHILWIPLYKNIYRAWVHSSVGKNTCYASRRTRVQILRTHIKKS